MGKWFISGPLFLFPFFFSFQDKKMMKEKPGKQEEKGASDK